MEPTQQAPQLITAREAAERLNVSLSTLHKRVRDGQLAPRLRGAGVRGPLWFDAADVEALLQRTQQEAGA